MTVVYLHVADDLRRRIVTGAIPAGAQLPSEQDLAADYQVGKPTLRRALAVLQNEGFVEKFHGRGNFARQPFRRITYPGGFRTPDRTIAASARIKVVVTEVQATSQLSSLLNVPIGAPLVEYAHLAEQDGAPQSWARVYLPRELRVDRPSRARSPWGDDIANLLTAAGTRVTATTECISARFPTAEETAALQLSAWTSVLVIERSSSDAGGRPVAATLLVFPGHRAHARYTAYAPSATEVRQ